MTTLKSILNRILLAGVVIGLLSYQVTANAAPLNSNTSSVTLTATLPESLTISTTVGTVNFNLVNGTTVTGSGGVPITTAWILGPNRTSVALYGSFASSTAALTDNYTTPDNIPSADVLGQVTTGAPTTFTAFSQTNSGFGAASASLLLFNQAISSTSANFVSSRTDTLNLEIAVPTTLPAGTYNGTLTLQAQAN